MNYILGLLWKFHRETFLEMAVKELYADIPSKVEDPAITILSEKRDKVEKLLLFMAHGIQRRIAKTPREVDAMFGMLMNITILRFMIGKGKGVPEVAENTKPASAAQSAREIAEDLEKSLKGVEEFKKGKKQSTP